MLTPEQLTETANMLARVRGGVLERGLAPSGIVTGAPIPGYRRVTGRPFFTIELPVRGPRVPISIHTRLNVVGYNATQVLVLLKLTIEAARMHPYNVGALTRMRATTADGATRGITVRIGLFTEEAFLQTVPAYVGWTQVIGDVGSLTNVLPAQVLRHVQPDVLPLP